MLDDPADQTSELGYLVVQGDAGVDDSYFEVLQAEEQICILHQDRALGGGWQQQETAGTAAVSSVTVQPTSEGTQ